MRLLEFESKEILKKYRIPAPSGILVSPSDPFEIKNPVVLKPQLPVGGRSKAGGILEAATREEAKTKMGYLFSTEINGYKAKKILIEEMLEIDQEFFLAIAYDTVAKAPIAVFSREGGVDIEAIVLHEPEKVRREHFSIRSRLPQYRARDIIAETGISGKQLLGLAAILSRLADVFVEYDATLAEINPLAVTGDGRFIALDCHLEIDDDAVFRHKDITEIMSNESRFEAASKMTAFERRASEIDQLDHRGVAGRVIEFDGTMGLIIGGGGASLTAFDAVRSHGGEPA
ncbi:MAG: acetate--CoA ligase family protein [Deltaproteobacteria bacterium]|nr:MAG: acetate--CoA ligase family protein [Deltaproteobacteria bacterium]